MDVKLLYITLLIELVVGEGLLNSVDKEGMIQ